MGSAKRHIAIHEVSKAAHVLVGEALHNITNCLTGSLCSAMLISAVRNSCHDFASRRRKPREGREGEEV
jgi:hypothetical protein